MHVGWYLRSLENDKLPMPEHTAVLATRRIVWTRSWLLQWSSIFVQLLAFSLARKRPISLW